MRVIELSDVVGNENRALAALLRKMSSEQFRRAVDGAWTAKDVLAHIAAYLEAERAALAAGVGRGRETPIYFDEFLKWNDEQYEQRRQWTAGRVQAEVEEQSARYLSLVKSLHEEDLLKQVRFPWKEYGTVHALILDGLAHRRKHREQLAEALGVQSS